MAPVDLPIDPEVVRSLERVVVKRAWPTEAGALLRAFLTTADGERLSTAELARRAGVSYKTVERTALGQTRCSLETGLRIARALGRRPWDLVQYTKDVRRAKPVRGMAPYRWIRAEKRERLLADAVRAAGDRS